MESTTAECDDPPPDPKDEYEYARSSRRKGAFRFKSTSSTREPKERHNDHDHHRRRHSSHSSHHRKRHHSNHKDHSSRASKRRHRHKHTTPPPDDVVDDANNPPRLSPDTAFRESLFDALGDDEGAAYWEGVYGQPIHTYHVPEVPKGPDGELERMSEEEYAAYVRARMWERTREGMLEEQERLRAERRRAQMAEEAGRRRDGERRAFEEAMEESLRRGAERKRKRAWEGVWREYLGRWEEIAKERDGGGGRDGDASGPLRNMLFWPVESGKRRDVNPDSVREFMRHAPPSADLLSTLKAERVRWHPDKMQHRYGGLGIDDSVMRSVTEVFQIVDRMWNEERERGGKV